MKDIKTFFLLTAAVILALISVISPARIAAVRAQENSAKELKRLRQVYQLVMTYDPVPALEKLNIPVLAFWGDKDTYLPVPESVAVFKQAMAKAGNKNYVVKIYPNANHSLIESDTGSPSTGGKEKNFPTVFGK